MDKDLTVALAELYLELHMNELACNAHLITNDAFDRAQRQILAQIHKLESSSLINTAAAEEAGCYGPSKNPA